MPQFSQTKQVPVRRYGVWVDQVSPVFLSHRFDEVSYETATGVWKETNKTSFRTADYAFKLRSKSLLPGHEYLWYSEEKSGGFTYIHRLNEQGIPGSVTTYVRQVPGYMLPSLGVRSTIDFSDVNLKFLKKLKGNTWQAGVAWAEAHKTSDLVYTTATRLAHVVSSLRRGRFGDACHTLGIVPSGRFIKRFNKSYGRDPRHAAANFWLELQYGWKPLLMDVRSAAETLAQALNRPEDRLISISTSVSRSGSDSIRNYQYEIFPDRRGRLSLDFKQTYRVVATFQPDSAIQALQSAELLNPATIVWELVPYSFVVDWFIPIGDTLSVLDADVGKTLIRGSQSVRVQEFSSLTNTFSDFSNIGQTGQVSWTTSYKKRETLAGFPAVPFPSFKPNLGLNRMFSGLALLSNQVRHL